MVADVVNICFHGIGTPTRELEPGEDVYWTSRDRYLRILDELTTWPSVRISFDDGNASDTELGLPALQERGLTASFFVLAGRLGSPGSLGVTEVGELSRHGMLVGTHGMAHRSWRRLDPATRHRELVEARQTIGDASGRPVADAACPLGRYDRALLAELRALGYQRVYTSDRRRARESDWLQPRFSVRRNDTPESLRAAVLRRSGRARHLALSGVGLLKRLR